MLLRFVSVRCPDRLNEPLILFGDNRFVLYTLYVKVTNDDGDTRRTNDILNNAAAHDDEYSIQVSVSRKV